MTIREDTKRALATIAERQTLEAARTMLAALEEARAFIFGLRRARLVGQYCMDADYRLALADKAIAAAKDAGITVP